MPHPEEASSSRFIRAGCIKILPARKLRVDSVAPDSSDPPIVRRLRLPKSNYRYEKKLREEAKKKRNEEKLLRKGRVPEAPEVTSGESADSKEGGSKSGHYE
jgi:hypothetical protein